MNDTRTEPVNGSDLVESLHEIMTPERIAKRITACYNKIFDGMSLVQITALASEQLDTFDDPSGRLATDCMVRSTLEAANDIFGKVIEELMDVESDVMNRLELTAGADKLSVLNGAISHLVESEEPEGVES